MSIVTPNRNCFFTQSVYKHQRHFFNASSSCIIVKVFFVLVLKEALIEAGNLTPKDIDAIAYTKGKNLPVKLFSFNQKNSLWPFILVGPRFFVIG